MLGPRLFTLYVNDLNNCSIFKPKLFADDTCFILQHENLNQLNVFINQQIEAVSNWMITNCLTLNLNKSNVILIKSNKICRKISSDKYDTAFTKLSIVDYAKYLDVTFDDLLSFDIRINNLVKKLSRSFGIMAKAKPFLDTKIMLHLNYAIFYPDLLYEILIWGSTYKTYQKKLGT